MAYGDGAQSGVLLWIESDIRDNCYTEAEFDAALDDVRVDGTQCDLWAEIRFFENRQGILKCRKSGFVGHERVSRDFLQRDPAAFKQLVVRWNYKDFWGLATGQGKQFPHFRRDVGGHSEISVSRNYHVDDLRRICMTHRYLDFRVVQGEFLDDRREYVACCRMCDGNDDRAGFGVGSIVTSCFDAYYLVKDSLRPGNDDLAAWRDAGQAIARSHEDLGLELVFEKFDLLAEPGLVDVQGVCR